METNITIDFNTCSTRDIIEKFRTAQETKQDAFETLENYKNKISQDLAGLTDIYNQETYNIYKLKDALSERLKLEKEHIGAQNLNILKNKIIVIGDTDLAGEFVINIYHVEDSFYEGLDFTTNQSIVIPKYANARHYWIYSHDISLQIATIGINKLDLFSIADKESVYSLTEDQLKEIITLSVDRLLTSKSADIKNIWETIKSIGCKVDVLKPTPIIKEIEDLLENCKDH